MQLFQFPFDRGLAILRPALEAFPLLAAFLELLLQIFPQPQRFHLALEHDGGTGLGALAAGVGHELLGLATGQP